MKAIAIKKFGGPELLEEMDLPTPDLREGQLLVRVQACALNPVDYKIRKGLLGLPFQFPLVPGYDVSGIVEALGPGVKDLEVGDEVFYTPELLPPGAYAELHAVEQAIVSLKPEGLTHVEAASVPLAGSTAWQALFDRACIEPGDAVLIHAAAGGVGSIATQLAVWAGCEVLATASRDNQEYVAELGADLVIDYESDDFVAEVMEATGGEGVDAVLDGVGGETFVRSFEALAPHGCVVSYAPENMKDFSLEVLKPAFFKNAEAHFLFMQRDRHTLDALARLLELGFLEPLVEEVLPFEAAEVAKAHKRMESGHGRGKVVISMNDEE